MTHIHRPDDQGLCACGFDASPGPHVVEMTAPTPSPEIPADIRALIEAERDALLAPLREENALLRAEATAHMGVARAAEAKVARLREALRPFAEFGAVVGGNARDHVCGMYVAVGKRRDLHVSDFRAAARALAEGQR